MNRIVDIAKRSQAYMDRFNTNVVELIESKKNSDFLIDLNRDQFAKHKDAEGNPLVHKSTGKTTLTKAYQKKTGKSKPNFLETGEFQDSMFFTMPNINEYFIGAKKRQYLSGQYGGSIFGISPKNQSKSIKKIDSEIITDYKKSVFK